MSTRGDVDGSVTGRLGRPALAGKVAVITGATSGIGLASARLFRSHGADVYITGRRRDQLDDAVRVLEKQAGDGGTVTGIVADSSDLGDLDRLFATVRDGHGRIDVLFASAGTGRLERMEDTTPEAFDAVFGLNARGTFFTAQKALPLMPAGGSIILTGSAAHTMGLPGFSAYGASKAAVRSYARTWASELGERRIRVNVLSPGPIETAATSDQSTAFRDRTNATIPLRRYGSAEEAAAVALFLASDDSAYVNAVDLLVDGGQSQT